MLAPLAPHAAEELWSRLGHSETITYEAFPHADPEWLTVDAVEYPVQVNGKVRERLRVPKDSSKEQIEKAALESPKVAEATAGLQIAKVIVVPGKLVNIVVK